MQPLLKPEFEALGLEITKFIVENISVPAEVQKVIDKKAGMKHVGKDIDEYTKFQIADSIKDASQNPGGAAGAGVGAGMGFAMGETLMKNIKPKEEDSQKIMVRCTGCDTLNEEKAKFCKECGASLSKKKD